jgi:adenosylcobinamide-GDP ribazoletransferase
MKTLYESIVVAFSMYSKIPMPQVEWNEKNMRFSIAVLPLVGAVTAAVLYLLHNWFQRLGFNGVYFAALAVFFTVCITGGIHLDGYCDTTDALSSHREPEEKLRILKDPHVGSFAVIDTVIVLLLQFGAWCQIFINSQQLLPVLLSFVLSRSLAGLAVVTWPCAKDTGLAAVFSGYASKRAVQVILGFYIVLCVTAMLIRQTLTGGIVLLGFILSYSCFYFMVKKQFGGMTGDLAGFYIVVSETGTLLITAAAGGLF